MVLIVGSTLLAWAVSLRLISDGLFALLGAYVHIWATVIFGTLGMLAHVLGMYQPQVSSQVRFTSCTCVTLLPFMPIRIQCS
jgi:hypothetical protein